MKRSLFTESTGNMIQSAFCNISVIVFLFMIFFLTACTSAVQKVHAHTSDETIKYSHVQTKAMFLEEVLEQARLLANKDTFANALHNLLELQKATKHFKIPNHKINFVCPFNKHYKAQLLILLESQKYPCDMEKAHHTTPPLTETQYKDIYGAKFADINNKEQFLMHYTKNLTHITTTQDLKNYIQKLYTQLSYKKNTLYDLQELKHYAFNTGLLHSYSDFYSMLKNYKVKCQGSFNIMTLDEALKTQKRHCKKA